MTRPQPRSPWMVAEQVGDVDLVRITASSVLDEQIVQALGRHLSDIAENTGNSKMVIDFRPVERVTSTLVGKLIFLNKKIQNAGGKLVLCGVGPKLMEVFQILRLTSLFTMCADEQEALQSF